MFFDWKIQLEKVQLTRDLKISPKNTTKIHIRIIKFHQKYFIESIPFEDVKP